MHSTCPICTPHMVVYSNVSGMPHTDPNSIRTQLVQQITSSIKWNACMEDIIGCNPDISFVEFCPGRQLKTPAGKDKQDGIHQESQLGGVKRKFLGDIAILMSTRYNTIILLG